MDKSIEQMRQDLAFGSHVKNTRKRYVKTAEELAARKRPRRPAAHATFGAWKRRAGDSEP